MKPLTINVDTSALDEAEEKVSRLLSLLKEVKEIIGSLKEALIGIGTDVTGWMYVKNLKAE